VGSGASELGESFISASSRRIGSGETGEGWTLGYVSRGLGLVDMLLELPVVRVGLGGSGSLDSGVIGDIGQRHMACAVEFIVSVT